MAAAGVTLVGDVLRETAGKTAASFSSDDPLGEWGSRFVRWGVYQVVGGFLLSIPAYFLKLAATRSLNDAGQIGAQVSAAFGNLGWVAPLQPFQSVNTGNAGQDLQNFVNDVRVGIWNAADAAASGVVDLALGIGDLAKATWLIGIHFPQLLWDGVVGLIGGAVGDIAGFVFPYLILSGVLFLAIGLLLKFIRYAVLPRLKIRLGAWVHVHIDEPLDRLFGIHEHAPQAIAAANEDSALAQATGDPSPPPAVPAAAAVTIEATTAASSVPPAPAEVVHESPGVSTQVPPPPPDASPPAPTPTSQIEQQLGDADARELTDEELAEAERNRQASMRAIAYEQDPSRSETRHSARDEPEASVSEQRAAADSQFDQLLEQEA